MKRIFKVPLEKLRSLFLNGLFTLLPIALTVWLFTFTFRVLKNWLAPIQTVLPKQLGNIPYVEFAIVVAFIIIIGIIMKFLVLRSIIHFFEAIFFRMPLVRPVYSGIKQLTSAFSPQDSMTFKKVVLIEFPRKGVYSLGFLTSEPPKQLSPDGENKYYNIYIPTTPNPTTGYFVITQESSFTATDLTTQEAMALIISGGIIQPDRYKTKF